MLLPGWVGEGVGGKDARPSPSLPSSPSALHHCCYAFDTGRCCSLVWREQMTPQIAAACCRGAALHLCL